MAADPTALFEDIQKTVNPTAQTQQAVKAPTSVNPDVSALQTMTPNSDALSAAAAGTAPSGPFTLEKQTFEPIPSVVQANETVQGQLKDLFDTGNPLMVQAKNRAKATAAGRGLQNSSLAAGMGELAQYNAAMPIAQQDANTYANRATLNNQTANQFRMNEQAHAQKLDELRAQGNVNAYLTELNAGFQTDLTILQGNIARDAQILQAAQRLQEIAAQGDVNSRLQLEQFGFQKDLSAQENLNRLEQLRAQGDVNAKLQLEQFQYQTLLNDQQNGATILLEDKRIQGQQNAILLEYAQRGVLSTQEAQQEMQRLNQQHQNTLEQIAAQAEAASATDATNAARMIQSQYLTAVSARQASASEEIAAIYQTPGLSSTQQNTAVQNAWNRMRSDIDMMAAYYQAMPVWPEGVNPQPPENGPIAGGGGTTPGGTAGGGTTPGGSTTQYPTAGPVRNQGIFEFIRSATDALINRNNGVTPPTR